MTRATQTLENQLAEVTTSLDEGQWARAKWLLARLPNAQLAAQAEALAVASTQPAKRHRAQEGWWKMFTFAVDIRCPRCQRPDRILPHLGDGPRFTCGGCLYQAVSPERRSSAGRCVLCGKHLTTPRFHPPGSLATFTAQCTTCQTRVDCFNAPEGDPIFEDWLGLPLRYATRTRHGWLYAYNWHHLRELRAYVGATLRESPSANSNWANRLPGWITSAKNRAEVTKALNKLLHDAQGPGS